MLYLSVQVTTYLHHFNSMGYSVPGEAADLADEMEYSPPRGVGDLPPEIRSYLQVDIATSLLNDYKSKLSVPYMAIKNALEGAIEQQAYLQLALRSLKKIKTYKDFLASEAQKVNGKYFGNLMGEEECQSYANGLFLMAGDRAENMHHLSIGLLKEVATLEDPPDIKKLFVLHTDYIVPMLQLYKAEVTFIPYPVDGV